MSIAGPGPWIHKRRVKLRRKAAINFTDVRVVDPLGAVAGPGTTGEIQVRGPNVIREYWNLPTASTEAFAACGWIRTGDIGHLDGDGFLYISDRLKDMIISGGENIYAAEVGQLVMELPEVSAVAVPDVRLPVPGERQCGRAASGPGANSPPPPGCRPSRA